MNRNWCAFVLAITLPSFPASTAAAEGTDQPAKRSQGNRLIGLVVRGSSGDGHFVLVDQGGNEWLCRRGEAELRCPIRGKLLSRCAPGDRIVVYGSFAPF